MKRIVLVCGLISGAILAGMIVALIPMSSRADFEHSELVGYASMVLAFVMVFIGIRSYRETLGGAITFGKAFAAGILITLIASAIYVATWEVVYFKFLPDFDQKYAAHMITKMRASGASPAAVAAKEKEMANLMRLYKNPLINSAMTFVEVFPVGLIVTLISAGILRRKEQLAPV